MNYFNMRAGARNSTTLVRLVLILSAVSVAAVLAACGSDDGEAGAAPDSAAAPATSTPVVQRIFLDGRTYTVEDLTAGGLKVSNEYDVAEFPGVVTAYHGLFNKLEYEVRFFASHADAVAMGAGPADEVSGPDAVVIGDNVKYREGEVHRRMCSRAAGTPHSGCSYSARYGDYIIKGNMILLCEGTESEKAMVACNDLMTKVPAQ